ncbi:N-acetylmuramic acid 6-phosphate etherase [Buttiauxella sp. WJP83]|uniref:N-acetylmuramic acid 6-phosphate etherase n=1 Tax=Buttiauxella sp. WJP83 TaxID=2986951 RepID=UPI0022DD8B4C|nr:N-acetylmuramic acid 6-phosphate etherase [Buttiauxella sp. WJP83]WBM70803.1 N-acetylmuramic acid 6-phosphate etherase [Buttiauxella sp. WJP83]
MSSKPTGSVMGRRNSATENIDKLATEEMLATIQKDDREINNAIANCLPTVTRLVDHAVATFSRGGRVVIVGAGASGRAAMQVVCEFAPEPHHGLIGLIAGGPEAMLQELEAAAGDYDRGINDLQAIHFNQNDMLLGLSVSGKTPWVWGALRYAGSLGAPVAVITQDAGSEVAQLADIVIAPDTGPEVVVGFGNPKARLAQRQILTMLSTGLAIRTGRVYGNLRVDINASSTRWAERQIAIVMEATHCSRAQAKETLGSCNHDCRTAILMLLTGLDVWNARDVLAENSEHLRISLEEAKRRSVQKAS